MQRDNGYKSTTFSANAGDVGSISGSGRSPGEGNGDPPWDSCLENATDRGAWRATVHGSHRVGHDWATKPRQPVTARWTPAIITGLRAPSLGFRPHHASLLTPFSGCLKSRGWCLSSFIYHTLRPTSPTALESKMRLRWTDFSLFPRLHSSWLLSAGGSCLDSPFTFSATNLSLDGKKFHGISIHRKGGTTGWSCVKYFHY